MKNKLSDVMQCAAPVTHHMDFNSYSLQHLKVLVKYLYVV